MANQSVNADPYDQFLNDQLSMKKEARPMTSGELTRNIPTKQGFKQSGDRISQTEKRVFNKTAQNLICPK